MKKNVLVFVTLTLLIGNACQDKTAMAELEKLKAQSQLEEQNKALAERWHQDLTIERNWEVADEILAADIVLHSAVGEDTKGIEEIKKFDEMWKNMPNIKINNHEIIAEGNYVLIRWDVSFDHTLDLMGIPASGNHISGIYGMDLFLIKDGKITDIWQNYDELGFMQQMGAIPTP
jgi:steroid delta-isomerase-like uncharacterized protein